MSDAALSTAGPPARRAHPRGSLIGQVFEGLCFAAATTLLLSLGGIIVSLVIGGWPALSKFGVGFLFSSTWNPVTDVYGAAGPIVGTLITAALALIISLPVAGGVAFFLTELCPAPRCAGQVAARRGRAARRHPLDRLRHSWGLFVASRRCSRNMSSCRADGYRG